MFYSAEILTSRRRNGFGVYWLAATLGSRGGTSFKRLTRKEILACDLVEACKRLASPDEPLALRLSSQLLCGITRVYVQQYTIYQADVTQVHQSLKKSFADVYNKIVSAPNIDLVTPARGPAAIAVAAAPAPGTITLAIDPANAQVGYDLDWDVGIDWVGMGLGEDGEVGTGDEPVWDLGDEGAVEELAGTPFHGGLQRHATNAHQARDLASINLQELRVEEYLMRQADLGVGASWSGRYDDEEEQQFTLDEDHPGILMGHDPELDALIRAASSGQHASSRNGSGGRGGSGGVGGAASSSAAGFAPDDEDLGGFEDPFINMDFGGGDEIFANESHQERVRREHEEGVAQRVAPGVRASSTFDGGMDVEVNSSNASNKRKSSQEVGDDDAAVAKVVPKKKKRKTVAFDPVISLSTEQIQEWKDTYPERMAKEREIADKAAMEKEGKARALDLVFGVPDLYKGGPLEDFYKRFVIPSATPFGRGKDVEDRKLKKARAPKDNDEEQGGRSLVEKVDKGKGKAVDQDQDQFFDYNDFGGGDELAPTQGANAMDLGGHDEFVFDFADDPEQARAGSQAALTGSQRNSMLPWNVHAATSDAGGAGADMNFGGTAASSSQQGVRPPSVDTPLAAGAKSRSRTGSLAPSALRAGSVNLGGQFAEDYLLEPAGEASNADPNVALETLERESLNFLAYAKRQAKADPSNTLMFSDIVPIASTNEVTAAGAFYHLLSLATKKLIKVDQNEAYGEIEIEFV